MNLLSLLKSRWINIDYPFLIQDGYKVYFEELESFCPDGLSCINPGDVVALVGDFTIATISTLIHLIDRGAILVPLTIDTRNMHEYFFEAALVDFVIEDGIVSRIDHGMKHELIEHLRSIKHSGLILFSTGTTGKPKAILHDFTVFLKRFETKRPTLKTLNFLLFDHIGGLNTLFHTLFNCGTVVATKIRSVQHVLDVCEHYNVEVLPTTPTFLRMLLISGMLETRFPKTIKVVSYGTERMDEPTLGALCKLLPEVDFRQTYGMSELGILRVKSEAKNSLYMKIGGEGVETRFVDNVLQIRSQSRMLGYLNAQSPFDSEGWYDTKDVIEVKVDYFKIVGRTTEVINVGGLKFMASDIEQVALLFPGITFAKVVAKPNPITGQHVVLRVQPSEVCDFNLDLLKVFLNENLQRHMIPAKVIVEPIAIGHRFKKE
jgi:acyl-coenzyme A synthetase/AMP-(fatty) acid ligase